VAILILPHPPLEKEGEKRNGFSLIEVLLTMAFVSILLSGMAELVLCSVRAKSTADGHFRRTGLIASKLENLKALPFESGELQAGAYQEESGSFPSGGAAIAEWRIEDLGFYSKRIELRITLRSRPERSLQTVLLISGFLGF